ncbi:MAG: hypothetical protein WBP22_00830 [Candidatus Saccharimonas sp.]
MTVPATFSDLEIEAYIAARDTVRHNEQEFAQIAATTANALSTLDVELAARAEKDARIERIASYIQTFLTWAKQNDWPQFSTEQIRVSTERKFRWKGLLGSRTVPSIEQRSVLRNGRIAVTSRGELVYRTFNHPYIIAIDDPSLDAVAFERMLLKLIEYYNIPIPS